MTVTTTDTDHGRTPRMTATEHLTAREIVASKTPIMATILTIQFRTPPAEADLRCGQLWERWTARAREEGWAAADTEAALSAAVGFLADEDRHTPDGLEDAGWHLMLAHDTECYAALCIALVGRRIEHRPTDLDGITTGPKCGGNPPCAKCDDAHRDGGSGPA
jgi:hypothetical protein